MTSSRQSPVVSDVTRESPGTPADDVIEGSDDDNDQPLERDIVRRRIDLFEKQVSNRRTSRLFANNLFFPDNT